MEACAHFHGGCFGEGDHENFGRQEALEEQVENEVLKGIGFSGAGAGLNQGGSRCEGVIVEVKQLELMHVVGRGWQKIRV